MPLDAQRTWTALTYPQDFSGAGTALGPQTILRLKRLVRARQQGRNISAVVLTCGIGPDVGEYPQQTRPFSEMMKDWLVAEGTFTAEMIHCSENHRPWNCIEVTLETIRMVKELGLPRNILVVSTGSHIYPRMWTTWRLLCGGKANWRLAFEPEWEGTSSLVHELLGTCKYIPMALWYRSGI